MAADSSDPKFDILSRYHALVQEWNTNAGTITFLQGEQARISRRAQDFVAAARVFGFDLESEYPPYATNLANAAAQQYTFGPSQPAVTAEPIPPTPLPRQRTVRDLVLEAAHQAYPNAVRAAPLRKQLEEQGIVVHEKTVGMTLYRLSRDGFIRRVGKADWFFVPENERQAAATSEGEGSPGNEPGLLLSAAE